MQSLYHTSPARTPVAGSRGEHPRDHGADAVRLPQGVLHPGQHVSCGGGRRGAAAGAGHRCGEVLPKDSGDADRAGLRRGEEPHPEAARAYAEERMEVSMPSFLVGFKCPPQHGGEEQHRFAAIGELACDVLHGRVQPAVRPAVQPRADQRLLRLRRSTSCPARPTPTPAATARIPRPWRRRYWPRRSGWCARAWTRTTTSASSAPTSARRCGSLNSFESIAVSMAEGRFQGYDPYRFPEIYDSITAADVLAFLRENVTRSHMALSVIAPKEEEA